MINTLTISQFSPGAWLRRNADEFDRIGGWHVKEDVWSKLDNTDYLTINHYSGREWWLYLFSHKRYIGSYQFTAETWPALFNALNADWSEP